MEACQDFIHRTQKEVPVKEVCVENSPPGIHHDELYVPHLSVNLMPIPEVTNRGLNITFDGYSVQFLGG